jgi:hypothetical protein
MDDHRQVVDRLTGFVHDRRVLLGRAVLEHLGESGQCADKDAPHQCATESS